MAFDNDSQMKSLPFVLTIKIKAAIFTGKITPSHKIEAYVETFINGQLLDRTLTGQPKWNRVIVEKFLYIEPNSVIAFHLYKKKRNMNGFMQKGTLELPMSQIVEWTNRGPFECEYSLVADKPRKLIIEWDLKESKLFSLVKLRSRNTNEDIELLREQVERKLSPSFLGRLSLLGDRQSSLMEIIVDSLIEESDGLSEQTMWIIVEDLLQTKDILTVFLEDPENVDARAIIRRMSIQQSERAITYPYGKFNYSKFVPFRTLFSEDYHVSGSTLTRQKIFSDLNEGIFHSQPVNSSMFDLRFEQHLAINDSIEAQAGYDLTIKCVKGKEYELHWQSYLEYINVLRELSRIRFLRYDKETAEFSTPVKYTTERKTWKDVTLVISYSLEKIELKEVHVQSSYGGRRGSASFSYSFNRGNVADDPITEIGIPFHEVSVLQSHLSTNYYTSLLPYYRWTVSKLIIRITLP